MQVILLGLGAAAASRITYMTVAGRGKPLWGAVVVGGAIVLNFTLASITIPRFGLNGVAVALVLSQFSTAIGHSLVACRVGSTSFHHYFLPSRADVQALGSRLAPRKQRPAE
ncbi:polysaccharide biosynthesis C-terminal domain-containing protein [Mesorhizobium japonicum]|uniref:polysaccharide biosynthesis C-terminal domain-containing protein n=1 Tax=Mesorhizobium japonicum TaxID=2066070 RepID=UPI003B5AB094